MLGPFDNDHGTSCTDFWRERDHGSLEREDFIQTWGTTTPGAVDRPVAATDGRQSFPSSLGLAPKSSEDK